MKKTTITYWTVDYAVFGANGTSRAWFRTKAEADEFAKRDYTDLPVRRTFKNPERIAEIERYYF